MKLLRGDGEDDRFIVRGRHSFLFSLELPPQLPRNIVRKLVAKYKHHLRVEIIRLLHPHSSAHRRTASTQSDSAISISSDKSGTHTHNDEDSWDECNKH